MSVHRKNGREVQLGEIVKGNDGVSYYVEDIDKGYLHLVSADEARRRKKVTATSLGFETRDIEREKFLLARQKLRDFWEN
jgi:hypothetical protein